MKAGITLLMSIFLISSISAFTYSWEQFDGSVSYYEMQNTDNPDIKRAKLIYTEDVMLKQTRLPYSQEIELNQYLPMCAEN